MKYVASKSHAEKAEPEEQAAPARGSLASLGNAVQLCAARAGSEGPSAPVPTSNRAALQRARVAVPGAIQLKKGKRSKKPSLQKRRKMRAAKQRYEQRKADATPREGNKQRPRDSAPIMRNHRQPTVMAPLEAGPVQRPSPFLLIRDEAEDNPKLLTTLLKLGANSIDIRSTVPTEPESVLSSKQRGDVLRLVLRVNALVNSSSQQATKGYLASIYARTRLHPGLIRTVELRVSAPNDTEGGHFSSVNAAIVLSVGELDEGHLKLVDPATLLSTLVHEYTHFFDYALRNENPSITDPGTGRSIGYADYREGGGSLDVHTQRQHLNAMLPRKVAVGYGRVQPWSEMVARFSEVGVLGGPTPALSKGLQEYDDGLMAQAVNTPTRRLNDIQTGVVLPFMQASGDEKVRAYLTQSMLQLPSGQDIADEERQRQRIQQRLEQVYLMVMMGQWQEDE